METSAFYLIMDHVYKGSYEFMVSPLHYKEVAGISDPFEKIQVDTLLKTFDGKWSFDMPTALTRAEELIKRNIGIADAVHLALAEQCADVFITCDDKLLKRASKLKLGVIVTDPLTFCIKENLR